MKNWQPVIILVIILGGILIAYFCTQLFPNKPEPEVVEVYHTDTIYVGYVDSLSVDGKEKQIERDYGFDRIFPIYHYKIIGVSELCGAGYSYDNPLYGERECGFTYFDKDIKSSDKATMNIYRCYDTTYDTTCYQIEDCGGLR